MKANEILDMKDRLDILERKIDSLEKMFKAQIAINDAQAEINTHTRNCFASFRELTKALSEEISELRRENDGD